MTTNLPVEELVDILGVRDALAFAEKFGGGPVYVPARTKGSELAARAGRDAAQKLASRYPSTWLTIPRCARLLRCMRDESVRREHTDGKSAPQLARKFRLTERHIWRILGEDSPPDTQGDLFG